MKNQLNEGIASEPYAARGDDASGSACSIRQDFKRNFVLQQLVALQFTVMVCPDWLLRVSGFGPRSMGWRCLHTVM